MHVRDSSEIEQVTRVQYCYATLDTPSPATAMAVPS